MSIKTARVVFWISTGILSFLMLFSVWMYLTDPAVQEGFPHHLGYPGYFRVELAIAKFIGVIILLLPMSLIVKEWAYAGFSITFLSAFIAHSSVGDPVGVRIFPVISLVVLVCSYYSYKKAGFKSRGQDKINLKLKND